ncbi:hypothetical protein Bra1253DRAFT_05941 [Bradyrhizobium sp. WSM1253]|nr:hypothetical protein Bra1253DRAFT_05941 [Bradyrhizobium sp. WSM1253]
MAKVTVHQFTNYDIASDKMVGSRRCSAREAIVVIKANVLENTAVEVHGPVLGRELSPKFGDGLSRLGGGGRGLAVGDLAMTSIPVLEFHTEHEL